VKKFTLFVLMLTALLIFTAGCSSTKSVVTERASKIDLSLGTTIGNHTYLPLYLVLESEPTDQKIQDVLLTLDSFEKQHPELEVTSWSSLQHSSSHYGIWINHRPKQAVCV